MSAEPHEIVLALTVTDAAAVVAGLGLVVAMVSDGEPPESVLEVLDRLSPTDALWVAEKVRLAVETQVMGMEP